MSKDAIEFLREGPKSLSQMAELEIEASLLDRELNFYIERANDGTFSIIIEDERADEVDDILDEFKDLNAGTGGKLLHTWISNVQTVINGKTAVIYYNKPNEE
jgi:hypothetical protein